MTRSRRAISMGVVLLVLVGCSVLPTPPAGAGAPKIVQSQKERISSPQVSPDDLKQLTADNRTFALALYRSLAGSESNLFFSPYSLSLALAMTYAGANGNTQTQMAEALHFSLPQTRLHPTFNLLDQTLASRAQPSNTDQKGFQLSIANALWGQAGYTFKPEFLDTLGENYGAGLRLVDFSEAAEQARVAINDWVSQQTQGRIKDLIPGGAVTDQTRLVLSNAVYFKAAWQNPFDSHVTQNADFTLANGQKVQAPMMQQMTNFAYAKGDGYQAVELPYEGGQLAMDILLPGAGTLGDFEKNLDASRLDAILRTLAPQEVKLLFPKFTFSTESDVNDALKQAGMLDAFDPNKADFSGMDGARDLFISSVLHKAFIGVDEAGTEAAASTAVVVGITAMPLEPITLTIDHPFIFLIRDRETGVILFLGRVMNPTAN